MIIAEIGINHNGDIGLAFALMDMAKECGADLVKFQKRDIDTVYTQEFLDSPRESPWGSDQRAQKEGLEFGPDDYYEIDRCSKEIGLPWFASAWDSKSLVFLDKYDLPYNKIASPMITHIDFLHYVADRQKPTFISTGMCKMQDIYNAVDIFYEAQCECILMHCVSMYPCAPEKLNLRMITTLQNEFPRYEIGYSGHEVGIDTSLAAVALGAKHIERHITLDRSMYGSDQAASVEAPGLRRLVDGVKEIERALGTGKKLFNGEEKKVADKLRYWE